MKLFLILFSSVAFAGNYISQEALTKIQNGEGGYTVHSSKALCGQGCVSIDGKDPEVCVIQDGKLVVDPSLQAAKQAKEQAKLDAENLANQKRVDAKEKLKDLPNAGSIPELRDQIQAIKDVLGLE